MRVVKASRSGIGGRPRSLPRCINGHPKSKRNTETRWGLNQCKICREARTKAWDARRPKRNRVNERNRAEEPPRRILPARQDLAIMTILEDAEEPRMAGLLMECGLVKDRN